MAGNTVHTAIFVKCPTIFQHYDERVKGFSLIKARKNYRVVIETRIIKSFKFAIIFFIFLGQQVRNTEKCVASVIRVYQQVKSIFHFHGPSSCDSEAGGPR